MAGQRVTFGMLLDGQRAVPPGNTLGESIVGPLGFLNILETQLGLLALHTPQVERVIQYRDCLERLDSPHRFYHLSFATDPLGTAAYLLNWRDQWTLQGWDGLMPMEASRRLRDLADIEIIASAAVSPGMGQRLSAVHAAMQQRKPDIEHVRLVGALETFPTRWRAVLAPLPVKSQTEFEAEGRGFLGVLQQQLRASLAGQGVSRTPWCDDGSVIVVRAETQLVAAQWLATQLGDRHQTLLVCDHDGARLDAHLAAAGLPRQGLREASAFRPALQVLPLALELLWDPLDFHVLLQFLTHPVCPIPSFARRRLAEKVADAPGITGAAWQRTLEQINTHYGDEVAPKVQEQIASWIEHNRFPHESPVPLDVVRARVERLADFFRLRLGESDEAKRLAFHAGYRQCEACLDSLKRLQGRGGSGIRRRQLQKLVAQATANGADNPLWPAEVGAGQRVNHPGAVVDATERVIWWQMTMPVLPDREPWSTSEIHALKQAGVSLPDVSDRLDQAAEDWLRPVMAARQQLVLMLPPPGEEVHPLWQMICAVVEHPQVIDLETCLSTGGDAMHAVTAKPLPAPKRWWTLPDDVSVALRPKESFSSLEQLLFNPYQWLLRYPAQLRPSTIVSLGGDFRMLGNLAHRLVERYFLHVGSGSMLDSGYDAWFFEAFEALVEEEGAILRMQGRRADLEGFRSRLHHSLKTLRDQVTRAGMVKVVPEQGLAGRFPGGDLAGSADLVMHNGRGQLTIVDMKWSGIKKFPEKLRQNRHLQLAIYAELLRQETGKWPSVAYFVLDCARFFTPDAQAFPDAEVISSEDDENTAQLWLRFVETWRWRVSQVEAGRFEVALDSISATEESAPPEKAMGMETMNEAYNDYRTLAGWGSQA